jgi:hypothetical protein
MKLKKNFLKCEELTAMIKNSELKTAEVPKILW